MKLIWVYGLLLSSVLACADSKTEEITSDSVSLNSQSETNVEKYEDGNGQHFELSQLEEFWKLKFERFMIECHFPGKPNYQFRDFTKKGYASMKYLFEFEESKDIYWMLSISDATKEEEIWDFEEDFEYKTKQQIPGEYLVEEIEIDGIEAMMITRTQEPLCAYRVEFVKGSAHFVLELATTTNENLLAEKENFEVFWKSLKLQSH